MIPGNLGANWLVGQENIKVGLVGYSPVFATSKVTDDGIIVNLLDFKSRIPLAYDDLETRKYLISFLNKHFKFREDNFTFIDGGNTLKTALSSPILSINAAAICDNSQDLINSKGKAITKEIYVLSETYSQLFQKVFNEQIMVAERLEMDNLQSLKDWLSNRVISIKPNNSITEMLGNIYKGKQVTISGKDRRITESFYALLFFKSFANAVGCEVPTTEELLRQIIALQLKLNNTNFSINSNLSIQASAISYADDAINKIKEKETDVYTVLY
ncbi:hypothetical protein PG913_12390 [Tenacibaculum pacificus]|uniref:hypothetical protein n=1 Tax=Tenacibaculum pacificus TaxID=3018314 RepID=UPI0022F3F0C3|nr:hypothetical protein [Tenacibaculum pacificus]WBX73611.1 hypothetical protein PG913_12390 [Tenacibaculum pacificus]